MYRVDLRDELGIIISKEFNNLDEAEEYYYDNQFKFEYIELRLIENGETIDHCYLTGSRLDPIWID